MTFFSKIKEAVDHEQVEKAVAALQTGGLILYPTDTLWSIGCDATDPVAIERVCNLRDHKSTAGFEILVDSIGMLREYIDRLHPKLETLLAYHIRPLTILFDRGRNLPARLLRPDESVAVRVVKDEFCQALIAAYNRPLIAVEAAKYGRPFPAGFETVSTAILNGVDCIIKDRQEKRSSGQPSVMVRLSEKEELIFLRE